MSNGVRCTDCVHVHFTGKEADGRQLIDCKCPVPVVFRTTPGGPWYADTEWTHCACFKRQEEV